MSGQLVGAKNNSVPQTAVPTAPTDLCYVSTSTLESLFDIRNAIARTRQIVGAIQEPENPPMREAYDLQSTILLSNDLTVAILNEIRDLQDLIGMGVGSAQPAGNVAPISNRR